MLFKLGKDCQTQENIKLGFKYRNDCKPAIIGECSIIRFGTIIYADVVIGDNFNTGHYVLIRENSIIGKYVTVGTHTIIEGNVEIGNFVKIESNVFIPTHTKIGSCVFLGPCAVLTNDKIPLRMRDKYNPMGPVIEDYVTIGANVTILPSVRIGEGTIVAAGSVVTKDIPPWHLAKGVPAKFIPLPAHLREKNWAKSWGSRRS